MTFKKGQMDGLSGRFLYTIKIFVCRGYKKPCINYPTINYIYIFQGYITYYYFIALHIYVGIIGFTSELSTPQYSFTYFYHEMVKKDY